MPVEAAGWRLDQFLAGQLAGVSRSRVQQLVEQGDVLVEGKREKASLKLRGGERVAVTGEQQRRLRWRREPKRFRWRLSTKTRIWRW